ncbi:MAG: 3'-5' exonuclease [Betaproteobacteria bacterium]|nr:3'-5' exonuclease [Betaproteobacteria bacterium]
MTPILAFDIETVPDCAGIRRLYELPDALPDHEVAEVALQKRRAASATGAGSDFLQPHLQRVVAIACVMRDDEKIRVWSLGTPADTERALIEKFHTGIERYTPQLVSWNGGGFDLPVLNYRALLLGVNAARFWESGDEDRDFRWNNYTSRYHTRHLDLMDVLAMYQPRNNCPLDDVAQLAGLPGKIGMQGSAVWDAFRSGGIQSIRSYCEADTANTYLLYLRFQVLRGAMMLEHYKRECGVLRAELERLAQPHWQEFLSRWNDPLLAA